MKYSIIFLFLTTIHLYSQDQKIISGVLKNDLEFLLPEKEVDAELLGIKSSDRQKELLKLFQEGIQKNKDWYLETFKNLKVGEALSYHPNFGMTEIEYYEFQTLMKDIELKSIQKAKIKILKSENIVQFNAEGVFEIMNLVSINIEKNEVTIGEEKLQFSHIANITEDSNGLKSKWKGYTWKLEEPKNESEVLDNLETLTAKQYKFTIGKLEKNGKTFVSIEIKEFKNGQKTLALDIPITF